MSYFNRIWLLSVVLVGANLNAATAFAKYYESRKKKNPQPKNISTLNGELVKVGNHNNYIYDYNVWNFTVDPINLMMGGGNIGAAYSLNENVGISVELRYINDSEFDMYTKKGIGATVSVPLYFQQMYQGMFIEPGITYQRLEIDGINGQVLGPQFLLGYSWFWDSGFNLAFAGGVGHNFINNKRTTRTETWDAYDGKVETEEVPIDEFERVFPAMYFKVGFSFD